MTKLTTLIRSRPALRWPLAGLLVAVMGALLFALPYLVRWLTGSFISGIDGEIGQLIAAAPIEIFFVLIYTTAMVIAIAKVSPEVHHDLD